MPDNLGPGTIVKDALAYKLLDAVDVDGNDDDGVGVRVEFPGHVQFEAIVGGAVTGTSPTLSIEIQGSDAEGFGSGVVSYGIFPNFVAADASGATRNVLNAYVTKSYARALVTVGGTSPVFNDVTVAVRPPTYKLNEDTSA